MTTVDANQKRFQELCEGLTMDNQAPEHVLDLSSVRVMFSALLNIEALAKRMKRKGDPNAEHFLRFVADAGLRPLTGGQEVLR